MMCSYNKLCFQCIEYKRRRVVRLPVDWYSIGESNGAPSPRNRTERRVWSHHLLNVTSYVTRGVSSYAIASVDNSMI